MGNRIPRRSLVKAAFLGGLGAVIAVACGEETLKTVEFCGNKHKVGDVWGEVLEGKVYETRCMGDGSYPWKYLGTAEEFKKKNMLP